MAIHLAIRAEEGPLQTEVLAVVKTPTRWHPVFVADLPSLVTLIAELGPVLASERDTPDFERRTRRGRERSS